MSPEEKEEEFAKLRAWNEHYEKDAANRLQDEGELWKVVLQARVEFEELVQSSHYYHYISILTRVVL